MEVDEAVLSRIINGYREPSPELRRKIAEYLAADEDWLFTQDVELGGNKDE
jgi:transcriptional regulator with XRE-family HTH domain